MPVLLLCWCVGYIAFGEVIAIDQGFPWDGYFYGGAAWGFDKLLATPVLDSYRASRVLPSAIVHYSLTLAGVPLRPDTVFTAFQCMNAALIVSSAALWVLIAQRLRLRAQAAWIAFVGMFGNVAILKMSLYYPPLTDTTAFFCGMASVWAYLSAARRSVWLLGIVACGLFTFPTVAVLAGILYCFPRGSAYENPSAVARTAHQMPAPAITLSNLRNNRFAMLCALVIVLLTLVGIVMAVFVHGVQFPVAEPVYQPTLYPSMVLSVAYMGLATLVLAMCLTTHQAHDTHNTVLERFIAPLRTGGFWLAVLVIVSIWAAATWFKTQFLQSPDPNISSPMTVGLFVGGNLSLAVAKPLLPFVSSVVYFGPIVLLAALVFPAAAQSAERLGTGMFLAFSLTVLLGGIMSESRQLINLFPCVGIAVACAVHYKPLSKVALVAFLAAALGFSKVWLVINFSGMQDYAYKAVTNSPLQRYFMHHGPFMDMEHYLWQASAVAVTAFVLWWAVRPRQVSS